MNMMCLSMEPLIPSLIALWTITVYVVSMSLYYGFQNIPILVFVVGYKVLIIYVMCC